MTSHSTGSSPQDDTIDGSSSLPLGKRAACDRCRGQKLRCARQDQSGNPSSSKCARCITAGTTCSYSPSKRAGRPPASGDTAPLERRGQKSSHGGLASTRATANKSAQDGFGKRLEGDRFGHGIRDNGDQARLARIIGDQDVEGGHITSTDELIARSLNSSFLHQAPNFLNEEALGVSRYLGTCNSNWSWGDDSTATFYDGGDPTNLATYGPDHNWSWPQTQPMEIHVAAASSNRKDHDVQDSGHGESNTAPVQLRRAKVQMSKSPGVAIDYALTNRSAHSFESTRTLDSQLGGRKSEREGSTNFDILTHKSGSLPDIEEKGGPFLDDSMSANEAQHRRMHELSELGLTLYSQLIANDAQQRATSGYPSLQDQFVGVVLKSSATFLALLTSFYPTTSQSLMQQHSVSTSSEADESLSEASEFGDLTVDESSQSQRWKHSGRGSVFEAEPKPLPADMTAVFQLLTCYIRIIHLHNMLYSKISDYLIAASRKDVPLPPVFPGMHVGGTSLDDFGDFQVKLLLQISTHMLGEIEMKLGLPDGYRISKKHPRRPGILDISVSVQFVEMTMRENGRTGLGMGSDQVMSMKDNLVSLRRLLKGTINI